MADRSQPRILLLGAGHANLLALAPLRRALPAARIDLIDIATHATYSGMFPGLVAGHYRMDELSVDLAAHACRHGATYLRGRVCGIGDRQAVVEREGDRRVLPFDAAALDIGSHSALPDTPGFADHAVPIKPLGPAAGRIAAAVQGDAGTAVLIGGGVAGAEVALALAHRGLRVTVVEAGPLIAPALGARARRHLGRALAAAGVTVRLGQRVAHVLPDAVALDTGETLASDLTLGAAGARAHGWMAGDLPVDGAGFVRVGPTLQVDGVPALFAAGDCAAMTHAPRSKAGVFAVRQAPVLARNIAALVQGRPLTPYHPQRDYLKIISLGDRVAVAEWHGLVLHGRWLWRWKDRIDRRFMAGFGA